MRRSPPDPSIGDDDDDSFILSYDSEASIDDSEARNDLIGDQ